MKALSSTTLSRLIVIGANAVFGILVARFLGPADKGLFTFVTLVPSLATTVALLAGPQLIVSSGDKSGLLRGAPLGLFRISIGLALLLAILSAVVLTIHEGQILLAVLIVPLISPLLVLVEYVLATIQSAMKFTELAALRVAQAVMPGLGYSLGAFAAGIEGAFLGFTLGTATFAIAVRPWRSVRTFTTAEQVPWNFVIATSASLIFLSLMYRVDVLVLGARSTASEVGYYTVAVSLTELSLVVCLSLSIVWAPQYVHGRSTLFRDAAISTGTVGLALAPILLFHQWIITTVFGDAYAASSELVFPMSVGVLGLGLFRFLAAIELVLKHSRGVLIASIVSVAFCVTSTWIVSPVYGAWGCAWATSTAYWLGCAVLVGMTVLQRRKGSAEALVESKTASI